MAKSKSYGGLIVLLIVIAGAAGGGWYFFRAKTVKQPEFQTTKVARGDITQSVTATGDLQPVVIVDIGAQVSGQIKEVLVDFNSQVKQGDVLARIDESTPTQKLRQAEADLESAEASNMLIQINANGPPTCSRRTSFRSRSLTPFARSSRSRMPPSQPAAPPLPMRSSISNGL